MSANVIDVSLERTYGFYEVSLGKKVVMAVTGCILVLYVLGHLIGNLQIFLPPQEANGVYTYQINRYAALLHANMALLWAVRSVLIAAVLLHIFASLQLWLLRRRARPVAYVKKDDVPTAYAARTMLWSGPIVAAFVVFHILHLTVGATPYAFEELQAYQNVVLGFRHPEVAAAYIVAIVLLSFHLYHGLWSMFQTVGISHPRYTPVMQRAAHVIAVLVAIGYISIPVSVLSGLIGGTVPQR